MQVRTFSTLEMPASSTTSSTAPVYRGKDLARLARRGNATERALLAVEATGATVDCVTKQQAIALAHANRTYVAKYRGMTELERADVKAGHIKLSDRVNHHCKPISDEEFVALVTERAERAWAVLEQLTAPNCEQRTVINGASQ
jgi:hypothetical protein